MNSSLQPTGTPCNASGGAVAGLTPVMTYPPNSKSSPEECDKKSEWEPEFRETFSKGLLKLRMKEFWGGKITQRYVETYLNFMHLSGMIDNLEYMEYKNALERGQL